MRIHDLQDRRAKQTGTFNYALMLTMSLSQVPCHCYAFYDSGGSVTLTMRHQANSILKQQRAAYVSGQMSAACRQPRATLLAANIVPTNNISNSEQ